MQSVVLVRAFRHSNEGAQSQPPRTQVKSIKLQSLIWHLESTVRPPVARMRQALDTEDAKMLKHL